MKDLIENKNQIKRVFIFFICLVIVFSNFFCGKQLFAYAESTESEIEMELEENIDNQLGMLDTSDADKLFGDISEDTPLLGDGNFVEKVKGIINGDISVDSSSLFSYFLDVFFNEIMGFLPCICTIIAIAVLFSIISGISNDKKGMHDMVHFVCYGAIVAIVIGAIGTIIAITVSTLTSIKTQMEIIFPILLTLLTGIGGVSSVSIYQPAMAVLSTSIVSIFINFLLPIFVFKLVFNIVSNLSNGIKLKQFGNFFGSAFKWVMGIVLTIFSAVLSIQGIMAGSIDGVSIKTAKFTIKSSVPLIGGFLSDGVGLIMVSGGLIKNAVGVCGLILMVSTIAIPVLKIIIFSFFMKFLAGVLEPIADSRISGFIGEVSKSVSLLIALILGVAFMYFVVLGLVMCSANVL